MIKAFDDLSDLFIETDYLSYVLTLYLVIFRSTSISINVDLCSFKLNNSAKMYLIRFNEIPLVKAFLWLCIQDIVLHIVLSKLTFKFPKLFWVFFSRKLFLLYPIHEIWQLQHKKVEFMEKFLSISEQKTLH